MKQNPSPSPPTRRAVWAGLTAAATGALRPSLSASTSPNVLILFADDQRADTLGAFGNRQIETPNLDRLARRGVSFPNAYNQGGHQPAVCIASRAMLLSGKSLWRATSPNGLDGPLLPERFAHLGYDTFFTGKWHNGANTLARSFHQGGLTHLGGMGPQVNPSLRNFGSASTEQKAGRATPLFADSLIEYLNQNRSSQKPFFAYCAFTAPHDPREAPESGLQRYLSRELTLPRPWFSSPTLDNGELKIRDEMVVPAPRSREQCHRELAAYYALITELDQNIGRVLKTLEDTGSLSNTLIVFAADNGLAMGAHGLMGKQSMYEHSLRVPLLMAGPSLKSGVDRKPVFLYELYGRLCRQCGVSIPTGVESSPSPEIAQPLYFGYRDFQRAIRLGSRKMTWSAKVIEQYDLAKDPHEEHNLWQTPQAWASGPFLTAARRCRDYFGDTTASILQ